MQRTSSAQPSGNSTLELPMQALESRAGYVTVQPRSCNPEAAADDLPEAALTYFDGTILWWKDKDAPGEEICYPDARVALSAFAPELLDEPPTNPALLVNR
ncbi:MAG: hypothetical protein U0V87_05005 [Acidobacteriota bacterium]